MMNADLQNRVEISTGKDVRATRRISGGDAAQAFQVEFTDGPPAFLKTVPAGSPFHTEALGLEKLNCPDGMRVPGVLAAGDDFILLEWISFKSPSSGFQSRMGEALAQTHLQCRGEAYGFEQDHFIGVTPQKNLPLMDASSGSWITFWWTHRLEPMFKRLGNETLSAKSLRLSDRLDSLLLEPESPPSLLHGDLWSGNVAADEHGQPVMFDPAPSYGHPEAELGMTRMFGGFSTEFYEAYNRIFPQKPGWEERLDLYMLYHVLNHACIFGGGYLRQSAKILDKYI